jgi:hypothetical protein
MDSDPALNILIKPGIIGEDKAEQARKTLKEVSTVSNEAVVSTEKPGQETAGAGEKTEKVEGLHQGLPEILHLIGHESGPQTESSSAGIAPIGLEHNGVLLLTTAAQGLVEAFNQAAESAEKMRERARTALVDLNQQTADAKKSIEDLAKSYRALGDNFKRNAADKDSPEAFNQPIQILKDPGAAANAAGSGNKTRNAEVINQTTGQVKTQRAQGLKEFEPGRGMTDLARPGQNVSEASPQFLVVLDRSITSQKLAFEQAVQLMEKQSANINTIMSILTNFSGQIDTVKSRLDALHALAGA